MSLAFSCLRSETSISMSNLAPMWSAARGGGAASPPVRSSGWRPRGRLLSGLGVRRVAGPAESHRSAGRGGREGPARCEASPRHSSGHRRRAQPALMALAATPLGAGPSERPRDSTSRRGRSPRPKAEARRARPKLGRFPGEQDGSGVAAFGPRPGLSQELVRNSQDYVEKPRLQKPTKKQNN